MAIKINSKLDKKALAEAFKAKSRLQIPDFLDPKDAEEVFSAVSGCKSFQFKYNDRDKEVFVKPLELQDMSEDELRKMGNRIFNAAMDRQFQYTRYACPLDEKRLAENPNLGPLKGVFDFLNGRELKAFLKSVTGEKPGAPEVEVQWHKTDSFQTTGDGTAKGEVRVLGYSLDLTREWDADWGGVTLFRDNAGAVEEVFVPRFNSLTLFRVPMNHSISYVTGYAKGLKLSISGYF